MNLNFKKWIEDNKKNLYEKNIVVKNIVTSGEKSNDPSTRADFFSAKYLGCVTVWKSGSIDIEVLDIEKISTVFFDSGMLNIGTNFYSFLEGFFNKLLSKQ